MKYWIECISEALDDAKLIATEEQIQILAEWVSGAHENYGMAFGHDCISSPLEHENKELKEKLKKEKMKVICQECKGSGEIVSYGPHHSSSYQCNKCNGEGRL